jgi:peroxiredoxin
MPTRILTLLAAVVLLPLATFAQNPDAQTPNVGAKAPDFTLSTPEGQPVQLSHLTAHGTVVLIVLRGFPGYQCPYCQKQAHDFQLNASRFATAGATLLLVYPGPPDTLDQHAKEFLAKSGDLPANFHLVIDPAYNVTNQYHLRWDAPKETAYPSTFIIDRTGTILARKISHSHGDRTTADDILAQLPKSK